MSTNSTWYATEPRSLPWVTCLVSFDTTSRRPNLGLIETIRDHLAHTSIRAVLTHDPSGTKSNLFATIPAHNGAIDGGIILSGHTDVVPVDGQNWDSDPFKPEVREGQLYGRGTCDMKGFIGAVLTLLPEMQQARLQRHPFIWRSLTMKRSAVSEHRQ